MAKKARKRRSASRRSQAKAPATTTPSAAPAESTSAPKEAPVRGKVDLAAEYLAGEPRAGDDAADARWVREDELDALPVNATTRQLLKEVYGFGGRTD